MTLPHIPAAAPGGERWPHNLPRIEETTRVRVLPLRNPDGSLAHPNAVRDPRKTEVLAGIRLELDGLRARALSSRSEALGTFEAAHGGDALHHLCEAWGLDGPRVRGLLRTHGQDARVPIDFAGLRVLVQQSLESRPVESLALAPRAVLDEWRSTLPKWGPRTAHLEGVERGLAGRAALLSWDTTCVPARYLVVELAEEFVTVRVEGG